MKSLEQSDAINCVFVDEGHSEVALGLHFRMCQISALVALLAKFNFEVVRYSQPYAFGIFHLNLQTVQNKAFQSSPEFSGTYPSSCDVRSICSLTRGDFLNVYLHCGLQAVFVMITVLQSSVDFLCKNSSIRQKPTLCSAISFV